MPTAKTTNKRATKSNKITSAKLRKKKQFNWSLALPAILLVVAIGGFVAYKTLASSYSFTRNAWQMTGGNRQTPAGKVARMNMSSSMVVSTTSVSNAQVGQTNRVCATIIVNQTTTGRITMTYREDIAPPSVASFTVAKTNAGNLKTWSAGQTIKLCSADNWAKTPNKKYGPGKFKINAGLSGASHSVGVVSINGSTP